MNLNVDQPEPTLSDYIKFCAVVIIMLGVMFSCFEIGQERQEQRLSAQKEVMR